MKTGSADVIFLLCIVLKLVINETNNEIRRASKMKIKNSDQIYRNMMEEIENDLTERKNAGETESKLIQSQEGLKILFNTSSSAMILVDIESRKLVEANNSFLSTFGFLKEEVIGSDVEELGIVPHETRLMLAADLQKDGFLKNVDVLCFSKNKKEINCILSADLFEMDGKKYFLSVFQDISKVKQTEEQIGFLASIVEYSDDAIISKSIEGKIKSWNKGAERMFGYPAENVIGENISIIVPLEYLVEEKEILEKICNNAIVDHYETVRVKKNGEQFFVSITVSPLKNRAGKIIAISKIIRDITIRKTAEDSSKLKDAFLSIISHEIRTPLNAIMGFSNILAKRKLGEKETEYVNIIKEAGESLLAIISDTIDMSMIEAGTMTFTKSNFSIQDVFQTLNERLNEKAKEKKPCIAIYHCSRYPGYFAWRPKTPYTNHDESYKQRD
jgi:PAS domain S-box-containing protein